MSPNMRSPAADMVVMSGCQVTDRHSTKMGSVADFQNNETALYDNIIVINAIICLSKPIN